MRLPKRAHTSRPWRIYELARDFRLCDVWALPTPGGPGDFPRLVRQIVSGEPSGSDPRRRPRRLAVRSPRFGRRVPAAGLVATASSDSPR